VSYSSYNHGFGSTFPTSSFIFNDLSVRGFWLENWFKTASDDEISHVYKELTSLISSSMLRFWLETYHISEYPFAFPRMEQKKDRKIVLTF
jgi:mitochondrial enoyl-[acyl-carrier protein] reductase / trans-2-enoyl-CoA reductase